MNNISLSHGVNSQYVQTSDRLARIFPTASQQIVFCAYLGHNELNALAKTSKFWSKVIAECSIQCAAARVNERDTYFVSDEMKSHVITFHPMDTDVLRCDRCPSGLFWRYVSKIPAECCSDPEVNMESAIVANLSLCSHLREMPDLHLSNREAFHVLARNQLLATFDLQTCADADIEQFPENNNVDRLSIANCAGLTEKGIKLLMKRCPNLRKVSLQDLTSFGSAFSNPDAAKSNIQTLTIPNWQDVPLQYSAIRLPHLKKLTLNNANINDEQVRALLQSNPKLQSVTFTDCPQVTGNCLAYLRGQYTLKVVGQSWTITKKKVV